MVKPQQSIKNQQNQRKQQLRPKKSKAKQRIRKKKSRKNQLIQKNHISGHVPPKKQKMSPREKKFRSNKNLIKSLVIRCLIPKEKVFAFNTVDRLHYMNEKNRGEIGYMDRPSGLILDQTISAPHMHAYAVKLLSKKLNHNASVLDVGCGSGYLTAIFGYCVGAHKNAGNVVGIDIYDGLVQLSIDNIKKANPELNVYNRIKMVKSDGWLGYPPKLKKPLYDCIHVGARADTLPIHLWNQLKPGGFILIPVGTEQFSQMKLFIKPKQCGEYGYCYEEDDLSVRYVPLQKSQEYIQSESLSSNSSKLLSPPAPKVVPAPPASKGLQTPSLVPGASL